MTGSSAVSLKQACFHYFEDNGNLPGILTSFCGVSYLADLGLGKNTPSFFRNLSEVSIRCFLIPEIGEFLSSSNEFGNRVFSALNGETTTQQTASDTAYCVAVFAFKIFSAGVFIHNTLRHEAKLSSRWEMAGIFAGGVASLSDFFDILSKWRRAQQGAEGQLLSFKVMISFLFFVAKAVSFAKMGESDSFFGRACSLVKKNDRHIGGLLSIATTLATLGGYCYSDVVTEQKPKRAKKTPAGNWQKWGNIASYMFFKLPVSPAGLRLVSGTIETAALCGKSSIKGVDLGLLGRTVKDWGSLSSVPKIVGLRNAFCSKPKKAGKTAERVGSNAEVFFNAVKMIGEGSSLAKFFIGLGLPFLMRKKSLENLKIVCSTLSYGYSFYKGVFKMYSAKKGGAEQQSLSEILGTGFSIFSNGLKGLAVYSGSCRFKEIVQIGMPALAIASGLASAVKDYKSLSR